jgi:hypothetical protein
MSKPTNEVKNRYRSKALQSYAISLRKIDDAELIDWIEERKTSGTGITQIFRELLEKELFRQKGQTPDEND